MKKRYRIKVYGDVQGVLFRHSTCKIAQKLNVTGWARNEHDDSVLIVAEGEKEALDEMLKWCHSGPPLAEISEVKAYDEEFKDEFRNFETR